MIHGDKRLAPDDMKLVFTTVPTRIVRPLTLPIPFQTEWHISRSRYGIFLVDRTKEKGKRDIYWLSDFEDRSLDKDRHFRIQSRMGYFIVPFNPRDRCSYLPPNGVQYQPLGAAQVCSEIGSHKFRCGNNLEFTLSLEKLAQKSLFA